MDRLGTIRGVVVEERFTALWIVGELQVYGASDLSTARPLPVDDRKMPSLPTAWRYLSVVTGEADKLESPTEMKQGDDTRAAGLIEVRRSAKRRRTVSAYRDGDRTVVLIPARMSRSEEAQWVTTMLRRLDAQESRLRPGDATLLERARALSTRYLAGRAQPRSVRWVANQEHRWGSCTPVDRTIRLSMRLQGMPDYVVDYVIVHELAHLLVPGHGADFWALVTSYPKTERARGYLDGVAAATRLQLSDEAD